MYFVIFTSLAALAIRSVCAQNLKNLPECAQNATSDLLGQSGCGLADIRCICTATSFLTSLQPIIQERCTPAEQQATVTFALQLCQSVDVTLPTALQAAVAPTPTSSSDESDTTLEAAPSATDDDDDDSTSTSVSASSTDTPATTSASSSPPPSTSSSPSSISPSSTTPSSTSTPPPPSSSSPFSSSTPSPSPPSTPIPVPVPVPSRNSTGNSTVATNKPVPYKGAASSARALLSLEIIAVVGVVGWAAG